MQDHSECPGVGDLLQMARKRAGLSQRTLSVAVGYSTAYVSKLEAGRLEPSFQAVSLLAVVLSLTPLELWVLARVSAQESLTRGARSEEIEEKAS